MGAAQSIPVVGEIVTAVDSGAKMVVAGSCAVAGLITNDQEAYDAAKKFTKDAGKSWVEYSERNVIAAPTRAIIHSARGNEEEADRVMKKMGNSVVTVIDNTPVVGHAKGVYHYIDGDKERGHACMKGASRTLAVAGAGALTGGLGAGAVMGGTAAASSGVVYDSTLSIIQSSGENVDRPYGIMASVDNAVESAKKEDGYGVLNSVLEIGSSIAGDFAIGSKVATAVEQGCTAGIKKTGKRIIIGEAQKSAFNTAKRFQNMDSDDED